MEPSESAQRRSYQRRLARRDANAIRRACTHAAECWEERVRMMQLWADYLDEPRKPCRAVTKPSSEAPPFVVARAA